MMLKLRKITKWMFSCTPLANDRWRLVCMAVCLNLIAGNVEAVISC